MPRVVIDTNVVIKGLFVSGSRQDRILRLFRRGEIEVSYSLEMVGELVRVINYPKVRKSFFVDKETVEKYAALLRKRAAVLIPEKSNLCRDAKDNMILGTAIAAAKFGKAYLVTEDEDLLALKGKVEGVEIVTPGEFLKTE